MAYYDRLKSSAYRSHIPTQLEEHITAATLEDASIEYKLPEIKNEHQKYKKKDLFKTKPTDVRMPARLASPLIPYPQELRDLASGNLSVQKDKIHGHHYSQMEALRTVFKTGVESGRLPEAKLEFDMDSLKRFGRQSYSHREDLINLATLSFAKRATTHDLNICAQAEVPFSVGSSNISKYTSFIIMIQRLRVHIAKEATFPKYRDELIPMNTDDAAYVMFDNGVYLYKSSRRDHNFCIISCGGHFRMYHEALNYWFCGPTSYLDYIFTIADILNNLDVLKNCEEYAWASEMFELMIQFSEQEGHHRDQVDFMKTLEGFLLNMSDYDESHAMNWKPILEAVDELWILDKRISDVEYDFGLPIALLKNQNLMYPPKSYFCRFIAKGKKLTRTHLQEVSALHKLIFYAEVNAKEGVEKFLKRVHTRRPMEENAVKNITRLAKSQFFMSYKKKHKMIPQIVGPPEKVKMLEAYSQGSDFARIESLPMSWWDDMKIFDCMDNTMTDDPLEFAKDKGALKSKISFGPGDSRKELLQVIERESYNLKDFFSSRRIVPAVPMVRRTTQKDVPVDMKDPARLIEKEREQKHAARLFANGELSNKHSLSLIAARMKKALGYFDEQLMTPTDKKRKALIHEASRELSQKDNYSLLLDIEGHNQSMQYDNTHELAEFLGNLFGYDGWGDLSHYFSQLTVYHYDEYLDDVTESHGQLGGIEGWLNPFWTLHTTLMMKLLRIMTDIEVKTIMVYSDDVNAVVQIKQASEPMVQSVFSKIMKHCSKFGMTVKYSQTTLSKHRITMLRQHYADGLRADSTLKRLISVSAGNNPIIISDELEVAGICSSASSAMELSNHHEACCYLKNYKLGLLLCRMPQMILSRVHENSMISPAELPVGLSNILYYSKDDKSELDLAEHPHLYEAAKNDIASYLKRNPKHMNDGLLKSVLVDIYGISIAKSRLVDSPDRVLYLQVYDTFLQDMLFFWTYLPASLGGLGAALHLNLMLSGHSIGISKSLHYLHSWTHKYSADPTYFLRYLSTTLSISMDDPKNSAEERVVTNTWPSDHKICAATTSVQQSIKSMVRKQTRNSKVKEMFALSDDREGLATQLVNIFRSNFHARIVQFYHENTSIHFIDLLISKVETSSGLLTRVRDITRLRNSICSRSIENIRAGSSTSRTYFFELTEKSDIIECLLQRKISMFPKISFVEVEEVLYDDKIAEVERQAGMVTVRRCAPTHYRNGIRVYDDPKVGNETLYKGELLDNDRMLGNKEELLAAKLVAVTKWFLMKHNLLSADGEYLASLDVLKACNLSLSTLTKQNFSELFHFAPTETGGEILHRIPNIRFSTATYIRSEMNRSLHYTSELNQALITAMALVDSNVNFDYLRMRLIVSAIVRDKYDSMRRLVMRYGFKNLVGIKDVQFVAPKPTTWHVKKSFKCYSELRKHDLSIPRFRYLSYSYLHEENSNEWALMPKLNEIQTAEEVGRNYVNDIILRYARDLDKDYMLISSEVIEQGIWKPVIDKIYRIDKNWKTDPIRTDEEEISFRLREVMVQRNRMTTVDKSDKVLLSLQTQCLSAVLEVSPGDVEFQSLVQKYSAIAQNRRHSSRLNIRLSQYQAILNTFENHRSNLASSLIQEYILTYHFKTARSNGEIFVDVNSCIDEFQAVGLAKLSYILVNPELQIRLMILGFEYVEAIIQHKFHMVSDSLREICREATYADIVVPGTMPSMDSWTTLTGDEELPEVLTEIEYIIEDLPLSSLSTIDQAKPLFEYASLCSSVGTSPEAFTSHTGSDSLGAQYSFMRAMVSKGLINTDMRICDLTAGRGDGLYAGRYLGLDIAAFSREDTFTKINHHPDITFRKDYDIFNGATIKFITDFDFVHVDVSFVGSSENNALDLIMMLEEGNVPYSIRLNSVNIWGYDASITKDLPAYNHHISYSMSTGMKPYQIYLIGVPSQSGRSWNGPSMKDSLAFKSMALSYSQLLSPIARMKRLHKYLPNSSSIYFPTGPRENDFIQKVCDDSVNLEQQHYLDRYISEIGEDARLEVVYEKLSQEGKSIIDRQTRVFEQRFTSSYQQLDKDQIGNVSTASYPYHLAHINSLSSGEMTVLSAPILKCDEVTLTHFRIHHPIHEIRAWCNIVLGLNSFCRMYVTSGHESLAARHKEIKSQVTTKQSSHQRETFFAIKLLVLAARDDNYSYGIHYCHNAIAMRNHKHLSAKRILKIYRMISYLFDDIQKMMSHGLICIRSILAISNDLEVREKAKYRYIRPSEVPEISADEKASMIDIITHSMDSLFNGLESYASSLVVESKDTDETTTLEEVVGSSGLQFDIGLSKHIEDAIARLNLKPTGPRGIIDLGDEDILEYDEW